MRPTEYRIPIPAKTTFVDSSNIVVDARQHVAGTSVHLVIDDAMLSQMGARGIQTAVDNLGAYLVRKNIEEKMVTLCTDAWVQNLVEKELKLVVRECVTAFWSAKDAEEMRLMMKAIREGLATE